MKFLPPYVKIIFYVCNNLSRIDFADIILQISVDENTRIQRLTKRENGNKAKINTLKNAKPFVEIPHNYKINLSLK